MELEQVYKVPQVAKAMKLTENTVYRLLLSGRIAGVKVGNRWRVRAVDVQGFLEANTRRKV